MPIRVSLRPNDSEMWKSSRLQGEEKMGVRADEPRRLQGSGLPTPGDGRVGSKND